MPKISFSLNRVSPKLQSSEPEEEIELKNNMEKEILGTDFSDSKNSIKNKFKDSLQSGVQSFSRQLTYIQPTPIAGM